MNSGRVRWFNPPESDTSTITETKPVEKPRDFSDVVFVVGNETIH